MSKLKTTETNLDFFYFLAQNMLYGCHTCIIYTQLLLKLLNNFDVISKFAGPSCVSYGLQQGVGECAPRVYMPRSPLWSHSWQILYI